MHKWLKKLTSIVSIVAVVSLSSLSNVHANPVLSESLTQNEQFEKEEMKQIITEINDFMDEQNHEFELKEQIIEYDIPLSNGESATLTYEFKKADSISSRELFVAKLGVWDFISTINLAGKGSIETTTTVNITHVPNMNSSTNDTIEFTAYNGRVIGTPLQFSTITGSNASTRPIYSTFWYETTGYVGFNINGALNYNCYFTQTIKGMDNYTSNRNKIELFMKLT